MRSMTFGKPVMRSMTYGKTVMRSMTHGDPVMRSMTYGLAQKSSTLTLSNTGITISTNA